MSPGSIGTVSWRIDRARVDSLVHEVDGDAGLGDARRERLLDRRRARERGQEGRVDVDGGEAREEGRA